MSLAAPESFDPIAARREVPLDPARAVGLVRDQFPELNVQTMAHLGSGWDYDAFVSDQAWVFRFPKRREVEAGLEREAKLLEVVGDRLGLAVPLFEKRGRATPAFPLAFVGYRVVPGVAADQPGLFDETQAAAALGRALTALHRVHASDLDGVALPRLHAQQDETPAGWRASVVRLAETARRELPSAWRDVCAPYLAGEVPLPPAYSGPDVLLHSDICPDHILADPATGRVTGLIDFTDAAWGDPVVDLAGLYLWRGERFFRAVLERYDRPMDEQLVTRARWTARTWSLMFLAEAAREGMGPANLDKHRGWIRAAFDLPGD